jgi:hypothetical protein
MTADELPPRLSLGQEHETASVLQALYGCQRTPHAATRVLALVIQISRKDLPFIGRQRDHLSLNRIAGHLGISTPALYSVLNKAQADGLITKRIGTMPGNVSARSSVVSVVYYNPTPSLNALIGRLVP